MRIISFWLGLAIMGATASAETVHWPDRMCSDGFDKKAYLIETKDGYDLHIGSTVEHLMRGTSLGTGMNGVQYISDRKKDVSEVMYDTEINMLSDPSSGIEDTPTIYIFRDRVFWPCGDFTFSPKK